MTSSESLRIVMERGEKALREAGIENPSADVKCLLGDFLKISLTDLHLNAHRTLPCAVVDCFMRAVERRKNREPVSYITGRHDFMGISLMVDQRALIPRPETELLVEKALQLLKTKRRKGPSILDIGTGSGCIALSLARFIPEAEIIATDVSDDCLKLAEKNAEFMRVTKKPTFIQSDLYSQLRPDLTGYFDMIISNPPYVSSSEMASLEPDLFYEPHMALEGGEDGYQVIQKLVQGASRYLKGEGLLLFETGYKQGAKAKALCASAGFGNLELFKDYQGHDRIVKGEWSGSI